MTAEVEIVVNARDNYSGVLGNFGSIITGIESAIHLAGDALRFFGDQALAGLDAIASWERLSLTMESLVARELLATGQFETMTDALGASGEKAEELLGWIQQLAINSPFTTEGVANAFRLSLAYGFTADEAQRLTEAMINFAAGSGASETVMSQIALALGQIEAKGKLAGQEVLQLVNAGLPVTQILADAFGVTTAEIEKMREDGLIPAQEAIEAITVYLETNFAGAAERQALSWAGLKGTFEDIKQMGLREFFGGMFEVLQPLAVELSTWLQGEGLDKLREWGVVLGEFTQAGIDRIPLLIETLKGLQIEFESGGMIAAIDELDSIMADAVRAQDWAELGDAFGEAILSAFTDGIDSKSSEFIPAVGQALSDFFRGAVGNVWFENSGEDLAAAFLQVVIIEPFTKLMDNTFIEEIILGILFPPSLIITLRDEMQDVGGDIIDGLWGGIKSGFAAIGLGNFADWWEDHIINTVKQVFGISSPSTVFAGIGRNIIEGLVGGMDSLVAWAIGRIKDIVADILSPFDPILDLLGIDVSTGTTGSHNTGTGGGLGSGSGSSGTGGSGTGGGNVLNFYGPVYVGSLNELTYDCNPSNPLLQATSGLGGGGIG